MRNAIRLVLLAGVAIGLAAGEADTAGWSVVPQRVQLTRVQRLGPTGDEHLPPSQLAVMLTLRQPEPAPQILALTAKLEEPLTDGGERLAIAHQQALGDPRLGGVRGRVRNSQPQPLLVSLTTALPTAPATAVTLSGAIEVVVGVGDALQGELHGGSEEPLAMTGVPPEQAPRLVGHDAQSVRLAIGDEAQARIASVTFLDGKGAAIPSWQQQRSKSETTYGVQGWPDDGVVRIAWFAEVGTVAVPVSLTIPLPGDPIVDETVTAVDVP